MQIITPIYPYLNSAFNVTDKTLRVILTKMRDAEDIINDIFVGKKKWEDLFQVGSISAKLLQ